MTRNFAICIKPDGYGVSLEQWKAYLVLEDAEGDKHNQIRVVDESGEDYLFPADWFCMVELPETVASLYRTSYQQQAEQDVRTSNRPAILVPLSRRERGQG